MTLWFSHRRWCNIFYEKSIMVWWMEEKGRKKDERKFLLFVNINIGWLGWFFNLSISLCPKLWRLLNNLAQNEIERLRNHSKLLGKIYLFLFLDVVQQLFLCECTPFRYRRCYFQSGFILTNSCSFQQNFPGIDWLQTDQITTCICTV